jgi:hypothetical protein
LLFDAVEDLRPIFSLKDIRGFRTASTADFFTHTFVPFSIVIDVDVFASGADVGAAAADDDIGVVVAAVEE